MLRRRPPLPAALDAAWRAFDECVERIAGARLRLLATLPAGRVEPGPVGRGLDAIERAVADVRERMPRWRVPELEAEWGACAAALDAADAAMPAARATAGDVGELDALLVAVDDVISPLTAFGEAERAWRGRWKAPLRPR